MRYISVFSGIEAASAAWEPLGWEPVAFSEIDPFPCAVLEERFPQVPNLGDVTKVDWRPNRGAVDIVVGGSPCQSFSVAGKREGLAGESGLMFEYIRAVREVLPRYFVWENVPGALSSEKGAAFGQLLREMDELGYGLAWRVLDAQFFGVAQRRRRLFLVGCLGDPERAAKILFEPESVRWDCPSSREKREELAGAVGVGAGAGGRGNCLTPRDVHLLATRQDAACVQRVRMADGAANAARNASAFFCIQGDVARGARMGQNGKGWSDDGACYTLNTVDVHAACFQQNQRDEVRLVGGDGRVAGALSASGGSKNTNYVCAQHGEELAGVLKCGGYVVRRLTPVECERLQGFPDGWTDVAFRGKPASDAARYKALGNSMAVPVMRWIGERVAEADERRRGTFNGRNGEADAQS